MDVHILYEHVERELYNAYLIKFELEKRGYTVEISPIFEPKLPYFNAPKLLIAPWTPNDELIESMCFNYIKRVDKILNMQYEQVISRNWLEIGHHCPKGMAKNANHVCWGEKTKRRFMKVGIPEENLKVVGDIKTDFSKPKLRPFFKTKEELSEEFNIPYNEDWILFISSFSFTKPNEDFQKTVIDDMQGDREKAEYWHELSIQSQTEIISWIKKFIAKHPDKQFIYRPHPSEFKDNDLTPLKKMNDEYPNFHLIFKYGVQDWIFSSEYINSWISTSILDVYLLNKECNVLRPFHLDEKFDIPYYIDAEHVKTYEEFEKRNLSKNNEFPIEKEKILDYYKIPDENSYVYKELCDYVEEIIKDDSKERNFYKHSPTIDKLSFIVKKIKTGRLIPIFKDFLRGEKSSGSNNQTSQHEVSKEKIKFLRDFVENN